MDRILPGWPAEALPSFLILLVLYYSTVAYAFQWLADRAFGKLKESISQEISPYRELSDEDLLKRIA